MSTTMTLAELMTAVRQRSDMVPNGYVAALTGDDFFVTEPELISYINQSLFELYDLMISCFGANYFVKAPPYSFTTDGTNDQYALPSDFYKILGLDLQLAANNFATVKSFEFMERNRLAFPNNQSFYGRTNIRYRLNGTQIWLTPRANAGQVFQVWYVPKLATLAALADTTDGVSGWTEYVIVDAAIKCLQKEETDVSMLMAQKQALIQRILAMADSRDVGSPHKVVDALSSGGSEWPVGFGDGGWPY